MSSRPPEERRLSAAYVQAYRADVASELEVQREYLRFLQKRPTRSKAHAVQILGWVGAGMLLGMGSLFAATGAPWRLLGFSNERTREVAAPAKPQRRGARPSISEATPAPAAEEAPRAPVEKVTPDRVLPGLPGSPEAEAEVARESWRRAAQGLKERDFETTNDALLKLSEQGSEAEREAARMVRAQLFLKQERIAEGRELLKQLAASASSPSIRAKAQGLLQETDKSATSHRSFELGGSTNPP